MPRASFRQLTALPQVFDAERAKRTLADIEQAGVQALADKEFRALLEAACGNSAYLARLVLHESAFLDVLQDCGPDAALAALDQEALSVAAENDERIVMARLRAAKRRAALAIALADIGGLYDLAAVTGALTRFADACVKGALRHLLAQTANAVDDTQSPDVLEVSSGLVVLAMGKHGAFELNYSSDIDLIVFYQEDRFPFSRAGDKRGAAIDIARGLVKLLAEATSDGYVFRVDLRLRPDAGATQIAIPTDAAEVYYEGAGQNWERAALIKARLCAGDAQAGARFLKAIEPFIWRKNLDYAAIEDIHSIKRQIHAYAGHSKIAVAGHNVKLGRGGIREIEFFAQTQQLIAGGRDPSLRERGTVAALSALCRRGLISGEAQGELANSYAFLRRLEHRLQMIEDQQTHTLPKTREGLAHIARFSGYEDTQAFEAAVLAHLGRVQAHYARLFEREAPLGAEAGALVFTGVENDPETVASLAKMGFTRTSDIASVIRGWHHGRIRATRSARAREVLTKLTPALLSALAKTADPDTAFAHLDRFLSGLPAGVQVFSLFFANPELLRLIAEIAGSAPRLAEYLGRNAGVLDALLDPDFFAALPAPASLQDTFAAQIARTSGYEAALNSARRFAKEEMFRIGVHVIEGLAHAAEAGPAYAAVADTVIAGLQPVIEAEMETAHGRIAGGAFAVVAQGKLGGREMTAASDLDLVIVYTHEASAKSSDGKKPLGPRNYFARASQRFIAALTALTQEGRLYDVDMRLRPSGSQGPVAVHLDTFVQYQREQAWTWERMALTRARVVSGPEGLRRQVEQAIHTSLTQPVERAKALADMRAMRDKLSGQYPGRDPWDIKNTPGGLIDIEFIAQALQLCRAGTEPGVLDQNTVAALEKLAAVGALESDDAADLIEAAGLQHALTQVLRIAEGPFQSENASPGLKALLARAGGAADFAALEARLLRTQARVRAIFERVIATDQ